MNAKVRVETEAAGSVSIPGALAADAPPLLRSFAAELFARAPADFFVGRREGELEQLVRSLYALLESTPADEIAVRVHQRPEYGHWASAEVVISDRPFVVDTIRQYLTSKGFEIRQQLHPVLVVERDREGRVSAIRDWRASGRRISVTYCEFEGHLDEAILRSIEEDVRVCMQEVRLATDDFQAMLSKTDDVVAMLRGYAERFPERRADIEEIAAFLKWLRDGGFVFLGYREYEIREGAGGRKELAVVRGSGLGILRREKESAAWGPIALDDLPPDLRARCLQGPLLLVSKANSESRVHRRARMDYVGIKKLDAAGAAVGERRFLGLFTWQAYTEKAGSIPILRRKLQQVLEGVNAPEGSHDYKAIVALFNDLPLEELFLSSVDDLRRQIAAGMATQVTGDVRVTLAPDGLGRGVNVMVLLPKGSYSDEVRGRLRTEFSQAFGGSVLSDHLSIGEGDSARLHFYIAASPDRVAHADAEGMRELVSSIVRTWKQRVRDALAERYPAEEARRLEARYLDAFPPAYVAVIDVDTAVADVARLEALSATGLMQVALEDHKSEDLDASALSLFVKKGTMILADLMPILVSFGLRVLKADAIDVGAATIHTFIVQGRDLKRLDHASVSGRLTDALRAIAAGHADSDQFNALVLTSGLTWSEVAVLRAYSAYAFQIGALTSRRVAPDALIAYPEVARRIFDLFRVRFDPAFRGDRKAAQHKVTAEFRESLDAVESIGDDLTLRRLHNLVEATIRTSYFRNLKRELPWPRTTFKFDCAAVEQMPYPRPFREMFVHSPQTVGSHLRFGPVARGGLRWSERPDDYRTEVLGLARTQQVKNTVIVPNGAKGAFYVRRPPSDRSALEPAVRSSYRDFVAGLLDVTDNLVDGKVSHPPETVLYEGGDPYLVVAADKGTAAYSDVANAIAAEYGFWLGDAFASGGSQGYDHKKEAITARGAWECVRHSFREIGRDINKEPVTVVGIGDMSGDVFGNGMLLSRTIRLLAAFDHRHIFIDPDPDPERSFKERLRLFRLQRSSWADYDRAAISRGGGIYPRGAKEIRLAPEARAALGVEAEVMNGQALIQAILRAPVDLLWNGGIGTYVKASDETHAEVGDSSNDAVRVDATQLRVKAVGEGGNLGLTQRGRIELALSGGRLNTDAIDNSGGVDMSDHEVNLKILLRPLVERGELVESERNALLVEVKDDVAEAVLGNNRSQARALSLEQIRAGERISDFRDASYFLENHAGLKRAQENLPGWGRLQARKQSGQSLTRPELAILLAYTKLHLKSEIMASGLPDDPAMLRQLRSYFPPGIVARVGEKDLRAHRLQREIIATVLTSRLVDLMGCTFIPRVVRDTGASTAAVARAWAVAAEISGVGELLERMERNRDALLVQQEYNCLLAVDGVLERTVRWVLENLPETGAMGPMIEEFQGPVAELTGVLATLVRGSQREAFDEVCEEMTGGGLEPELATRLAALQFLGDLMAAVRIAREQGAAVVDVGLVYFALNDEVDFALLHELLGMAPGEDEWEQRAAQGLVQDVGQVRRNLTLAVLKAGGKKAAVEKRIEAFRTKHAARLSAIREVLGELLESEHVNLAALTVALRETVRHSAAILDGRA